MGKTEAANDVCGHDDAGEMYFYCGNLQEFVLYTRRRIPGPHSVLCEATSEVLPSPVYCVLTFLSFSLFRFSRRVQANTHWPYKEDL